MLFISKFISFFVAIAGFIGMSLLILFIGDPDGWYRLKGFLIIITWPLYWALAAKWFRFLNNNLS